MKLWEFLWKIVGQLIIIQGIIGIITIANWTSGVTVTMPEEAFFYVIPFCGYITCGIVIIIGIITLGGWFWNRHPKIIILYTLSFLIGLASIIGCYAVHNDNAFKITLSILGMCIVILTTLTILLKTFSARNTRKQWKLFITLSILTVYLVLMVGFVFPQWLDAVALSFPDPALREEIRKEIGKPFGFTTQSDLKKITSLVIWGYDGPKITRLDGLEKCTGLEELILGWSWDVQDISPLSNLTNLQYLQITYYDRLSDITPLSNLRQLTQLKLYSDSVTDISCLSNLTKLYKLNMSSNAIVDISPLANLTNLSRLDLSRNSIESVSPLSNLLNLSYLDINSNSIEDLSSLVNLTGLTELDFGNNQVTDMSTLNSLSKLTNLTISGNPINDITPLSNLPELNILFMFGSFSNISPLLDNTGLGPGDKIYFGSTQLDSYSSSVVVPELTSRGVSFYHEGWGLLE